MNKDQKLLIGGLVFAAIYFVLAFSGNFKYSIGMLIVAVIGGFTYNTVQFYRELGKNG